MNDYWKVRLADQSLHVQIRYYLTLIAANSKAAPIQSECDEQVTWGRGEIETKSKHAVTHTEVFFAEGYRQDTSMDQ